MTKATIYTHQYCQYCKMAKAYFNEKGVQYEEKDVLEDMEARQEMVEKSGQLGVPVIVIEDNVVIGFDRNALEHILEHSK